MTVEELIKELSAFPPETEVVGGNEIENGEPYIGQEWNTDTGKMRVLVMNDPE